MTTNVHEDVVTILARQLYAAGTKSWIPARIRLWMWNHGITRHTVKARFENIAAEALRETFNYEEPNA